MNGINKYTVMEQLESERFSMRTVAVCFFIFVSFALLVHWHKAQALAKLRVCLRSHHAISPPTLEPAKSPGPGRPCPDQMTCQRLSFGDTIRLLPSALSRSSLTTVLNAGARCIANRGSNEFRGCSSAAEYSATMKREVGEQDGAAFRNGYPHSLNPKSFRGICIAAHVAVTVTLTTLQSELV